MDVAAISPDLAAEHRVDKKQPVRKRRKPAKTRLAAALADLVSVTSDSARDAALASVEVEYVPQPLVVDPMDPGFYEFARVFDKFRLESVEDAAEVDLALSEAMAGAVDTAHDAAMSDASDGSETQEISRKQLRMMARMSVATLKQTVAHPEVVDWVDASAADPLLLVHLKSYRNTVPVPVHWSQKRKYLQSKRGIEKPPFVLPQFIRDTGIQEMRDAGLEQQAEKSMKSKMRDHTRPRMGRIDIDYQKLHDAFFRFQTRPENMSQFGDMYYEGKEFEARLKHQRPGNMSEELRAALNIPPLAPPPWLINMQRFGPPPAYPGLRISGLNAPIPEGAQWGYHPGGWGRPPVDEFNRPLYGDVFGMEAIGGGDTSGGGALEGWKVPVQRELWGALEAEPELEEDEEELEEFDDEEDDEQAGEADMDGADMMTDGAMRQGLETPSGIVSSVPSGLETPEHIELRKDVSGGGHRYGPPASANDAPRELYRVLPQQEARLSGGGIMGTQHLYDTGAGSGKRKGAVEVALDPDELERNGLDRETLQAKFDAEVRARQPQHENLGDMVSEHISQQARKRQRVEDQGGMSGRGGGSKTEDKSRKHKEYKF